MNIIFYSGRNGGGRSVNLSHPLTLSLLGLLGLSVLASAFGLGLRLGGRRSAAVSEALLAAPVAAVHAEQSQIKGLRAQVQDHIDALAMRVGVMDAELLRLDALGRRLTQMAHIKSGEFNFDQAPPLGGPDTSDGPAAQVPSLTAMLNAVSQRIDRRSAQLSVLQNVLLGRQLSAEIKPTGRPVVESYISSGYGERIDPFTGKEAFHPGIDFAAPKGEDVLAVASGIVTFAGRDGGYGNLVQIDHGDGYSTRYGHNEKILVHVGEQVQRGQAIALVGSTGRSTGPHVHFEVLRNGREINPSRFVRR